MRTKYDSTAAADGRGHVARAGAARALLAVRLLAGSGNGGLGLRAGGAGATIGLVSDDGLVQGLHALTLLGDEVELRGFRSVDGENGETHGGRKVWVKLFLRGRERLLLGGADEHIAAGGAGNGATHKQ